MISLVPLSHPPFHQGKVKKWPTSLLPAGMAVQFHRVFLVSDSKYAKEGNCCTWAPVTEILKQPSARSNTGLEA